MPAHHRRLRAAVLTAFAAVALAACAHPVALPVAEPVPEVAAVPPGLERYYAQPLAWGPCAALAGTEEDRALFADPKLECARLEVPLDYAAPEGRTAQIAVLRHRTDQQKIGSLVLNPGGPGGSGISFAAQLGGVLGGGPFDVVGFDPRGVGASTPAIDCFTDQEWDAERAAPVFDDSPAGVEQAEADGRLDAERCVQRSGGVDVIANAGTRDVAKDLDVLRAALGDHQLTYLGFSYGTRIGATYAELFPGNVRAMVLDGADDPMQTAVESSLAQARGFQEAFDAYAADCTRAAGCPLGSDPAAATARFRELTRPLLDRPAPVPGPARTLSYSDAITATVAALYSPQAWPQLTAGLTQLRAGDGTVLLELADGYHGRGPDGRYGNSQEALLVVNCLDGSRITDRATMAELARRSAEVAPFADPGRGASGALATCAFLPVTPTMQPHLPNVAGLPQTLVISTTGDPATPYQAGVDLAKALNARLLTAEGTQHTAALHGYSCVDTVVADYLVNLTLPDQDVRCSLTNP